MDAKGRASSTRPAPPTIRVDKAGCRGVPLVLFEVQIAHILWRPQAQPFVNLPEDQQAQALILSLQWCSGE